MAPRINSLRDSDVHRINDLDRAAQERQPATALRHASYSHTWKALEITGKVMRDMRDDFVGTMSWVGWSERWSVGGAVGACRYRREKMHCGAAYGGRPALSSSLAGPCHILQWTSKLTRKLARSSLGGEVYALCEIDDRMTPIRDFFGPLEGLAPGMVGLEDCESLLTHLRTKKPKSEKYLARRFLSIHKAL